MPSPTVAILEDDIDVRSIVEAAVAADGYRSLSFGTIGSLKAADMLDDVALYLLDIALPDGDGLEEARLIRGLNPHVGIILITGRSDEIDTVLGLELGADDYITKPFKVRELRARIKAVLRRCTAASPSSLAAEGTVKGDLVIAGLRINRVARSVRSPDDKPVSLTTLEYDVLIALVTPPNRVLSREQIMDKVRGQDWAVYDRTVDGIVSRLRTKLFSAGAGHDVIKTVRNVGYMFSSVD